MTRKEYGKSQVLNWGVGGPPWGCDSLIHMQFLAHDSAVLPSIQDMTFATVSVYATRAPHTPRLLSTTPARCLAPTPGFTILVLRNGSPAISSTTTASTVLKECVCPTRRTKCCEKPPFLAICTGFHYPRRSRSQSRCNPRYCLSIGSSMYRTHLVPLRTLSFDLH